MVYEGLCGVFRLHGSGPCGFGVVGQSLARLAVSGVSFCLFSFQGSSFKVCKGGGPLQHRLDGWLPDVESGSNVVFWHQSLSWFVFSLVSSCTVTLTTVLAILLALSLFQSWLIDIVTVVVIMSLSLSLYLYTQACFCTCGCSDYLLRSILQQLLLLGFYACAYERVHGGYDDDGDWRWVALCIALNAVTATTSTLSVVVFFLLLLSLSSLSLSSLSSLSLLLLLLLSMLVLALFVGVRQMPETAALSREQELEQR